MLTSHPAPKGCVPGLQRHAARPQYDAYMFGLMAASWCSCPPLQELQQCLDLGLHIGITGWVCDDRPERGGAELAALLPTIPADRLMIETDAPYLVPRTIKPNKARPGRNEPALLPHVLQQVAASLGKEPEQVAQQTAQVACQFFGIHLPSSADQ